MFKYELATSLMLNIEKYCYSYLNGLADLWCLRGRCLPIALYAINKPSTIVNTDLVIHVSTQTSCDDRSISNTDRHSLSDTIHVLARLVLIIQDLFFFCISAINRSVIDVIPYMCVVIYFIKIESQSRAL